MNPAKGILIIIAVITVAAIAFILTGGDDSKVQRASSQSRTPPARSADEATYSEEVRQLTALQRQQEEAQRLENLALQAEVERLRGQMENPEPTVTEDPRVNELEKKLESVTSLLRDSLNPLQQTVARLANNQAQSNNNNRAQAPSNGFTRQGYTSVTPFSPQRTATATPLTSSGVPFNARVNQDNLIPVYTIPKGSIMSDSLLVTPLIGRVPNLNNNVGDPFRFRITTGSANITANGHTITGIKDAIWSGSATGVREESCIRGFIDSVTFVFEDGTISTFPDSSGGRASTASTSISNSNTIGFLATPGGLQCVPGSLVSNASAYLEGRTKAAFAEGLAQAFATAQTTVDRTDNGNLSALVDGNTLQFGIGRGISRSASEVADYIRDRQANAFDVVFLPNNQPVTIMIEQEIPIDYDRDGRKVEYTYLQNGAG